MNTYDIIIIGGGISGLAVAAEASQRGFRVALLEAGRCGSQTSNNTLRIFHGGFRYLQKFDIRRVLTSLHDQSRGLLDYPDAITPLSCLMPLRRFGLKSRIPCTCAATLYGALMSIKGSPLPHPTVRSANDIVRDAPIVSGLAPWGALQWYDGLMVNPAAITAALLASARAANATIIEERPVTKVIRHAPHDFSVIDKEGAEYKTRHVITTLGPWLNAVNIPPSLIGTRPLWCKGFNLIIRRQLDPTYAIGIESPEGRLFFCTPRGSGTAIGTYYVAHPALSLGHAPSVSSDEIDIFLKAFNAVLPGAAINRSEVEGVDVGVLPMLRDSPSGPILQGREEIHSRDGYIEVLSTKYTTFRSQAEQVMGFVRTASVSR